MITAYNPTTHSSLVPYMAVLHATCISSDKTITTFIPPIANDRLLQWWKDRIAESVRGERAIFLLLEADSFRPLGARLTGLVMLDLSLAASSETATHRATVETLLVGSDFRGKGGARRLMNAVEAEARARGRFLLVSKQTKNKKKSPFGHETRIETRLFDLGLTTTTSSSTR